MLDIGWTELVVIAIILIVVVGPKDLPPMLRTFGKMMTKFRGVASDFRQQFDEALKEADLDDVRKTLSDAQKLNPAHSLREAMNPLRQMGNDIKSDLQRATSTPAKPVVAATEPSAVAGEPSPEPVVETAASAPVADTVAAAAIASATRQSTRAAEAEAAVETPKRVSKAKTVAAPVLPIEPVVVKTPRTTKAAVKTADTVVVADEKPKVRKAAVKTKSKGDA
ncbi:Sec-independent protein translocase protein TatB [Pararhizobium antarcticum]|uniref:Sec-independent protein translocase protein TatB n=1 Tax=Pararhizobium antarcticum TaxID=1798805 RepID=A0A657LPG6_9HYPH|nr:Sec-independent protein translocase protein TatB [Pararhizobium antarcticum]OJF89949.1 preprotein translocase [Pararhizobium antarcticum]OJF93218.1 preprotein translocase [Rhizobium sp. 58]